MSETELNKMLEEFNADKAHHLEVDESQRQIILLALDKLKREQPGWDYAIGQIEQKLGGQLDWPEYSISETANWRRFA